jgi:hypothetical protein
MNFIQFTRSAFLKSTGATGSQGEASLKSAKSAQKYLLQRLAQRGEVAQCLRELEWFSSATANDAVKKSCIFAVGRTIVRTGFWGSPKRCGA